MFTIIDKQTHSYLSILYDFLCGILLQNPYTSESDVPVCIRIYIYVTKIGSKKIWENWEHIGRICCYTPKYSAREVELASIGPISVGISCPCFNSIMACSDFLYPYMYGIDLRTRISPNVGNREFF